MASSPVDQRDAAGRSAPMLVRLVVAALGEREDEEDEPEHERQVNAAMRRLAQQAETGRVVVEQRQRDEQRRRRSARRRRQRPEPHLGVELLLEFPGFRLVEFQSSA